MTYKVKVTGQASFKAVKLRCKCGYEEDRTIDVRGMSEEERAQAGDGDIKCPNCEGETYLERVFGAPAYNKIGADNSDSGIRAIRKSFKQRFIKKDLDDVRHKHGRLYDDSIASAAAQRIKKGEKPIGND